MISPSQHVLLEAIKASLFGGEPDYPEDTNWEEVVAEAKTQTVLGLISSVIPVHDESADQCKASYMRIMYEQDRLVKLLDSANIPCVILKGSAAAVYYPMPYLRTMGDIDVLIQHDRFIESVELLESNGYVYEHGKEANNQITEETREIEYKRNSVSVELHQRFSSPGVDVDDILEEAISRKELIELNGYRFPMLPILENGLVLLGHINQHLKNNVLGIRQIIDWEMYVHSVKDKTSWIMLFTPLAERTGLLTLAAYVTRMCNRYLGLPESFDMCNGIDDDLTDELLDVIMTDGNFGRREESLSSRDEKRMRSAIYSVKRYGFFKYFTDVGLNTWRLGKNHPVLKPLAFFYGLFRQIGEGIKALVKNKGVGKQMSAGKRRYELYKELGVRNGEK